MPDIKIRRSNPVRFVRTFIVDIATFCVRPQPAPATLAWGQSLILALATIVTLDVAFGYVIVAMLDQLDASVLELPKEIEIEETVWESFFFLVILAPLLEEPTFRGFFSGQRAGIRFGFIAIGVTVALALLLYFPNFVLTSDWFVPIGFILFAILLFGLIQWSVTRRKDIDTPDWFNRYYHWLVWGSALLFGLIHIGNYQPLSSSFQLIVVAPQAIGGLLLIYTRTRFGLLAAIAHHAAFNAVYWVTAF